MNTRIISWWLDTVKVFIIWKDMYMNIYRATYYFYKTTNIAFLLKNEADLFSLVLFMKSTKMFSLQSSLLYLKMRIHNFVFCQGFLSNTHTFFYQISWKWSEIIINFDHSMNKWKKMFNHTFLCVLCNVS